LLNTISEWSPLKAAFGHYELELAADVLAAETHAVATGVTRFEVRHALHMVLVYYLSEYI
jgi:hypothetical protein